MSDLLSETRGLNDSYSLSNKQKKNISSHESACSSQIWLFVEGRLAMLARGQFGRAVRRNCSNGMVSMDDPAVRAAFQTKYKPRENIYQLESLKISACSPWVSWKTPY